MPGGLAGGTVPGDDRPDAGHRLTLIGTIVGALIAATATITAAVISDDGDNKTQVGSTTNVSQPQLPDANPPTAATSGASTGSGGAGISGQQADGAPSSQPSPSSRPRITLIAEQPVTIGQRYTISGSGFRPFEYVELQVGGFFFSNDQADSSGAFSWLSEPVYQFDCPLSPRTIDVTRGGPGSAQGYEFEIVGTLTVRLCA